MSKTDYYYNKYLIYKQKYINLKGGSDVMMNQPSRFTNENNIDSMMKQPITFNENNSDSMMKQPITFNENNSTFINETNSTFINETNSTECIINKILKELKITDDLQDYITDQDNNITNNNLTTYMLNLFIKYKVNNKNTLQYSHWVYNNQILMSAIPTDCNDINHIININKINMVISLRENDELYQRCDLDKKLLTQNSNYDDDDYKNYNRPKPIFWRFRVPDYGYQDPHDFKALIDNIINYVQNLENKIMIHCLGGHGRTGSVICSIIAILVILQENIFKTILKELITLNNLPKIDNLSESNNMPEINKIITKNNTLTNIGMLTNFIARKVFVLSQIFVMLSLRMYRKTDGIDYRDTIHKILVPETHAQNEMVINVIKLFIQEYVNNGNFMFNIDSEDNCTNNKIWNANFEKSWKCAQNVDKSTTITGKSDCDNKGI